MVALCTSCTAVSADIAPLYIARRMIWSLLFICFCHIVFWYLLWLFQGLKSHAVTMFEVGKLNDESLDSFLTELGKVSRLKLVKCCLAVHSLARYNMYYKECSSAKILSGRDGIYHVWRFFFLS